MTATVTAVLGQAPDDGATQQPEDLELTSVTTVIGVLEKPALLYWAAGETAAAAVAIAGSLPTRIAEDGEEETIKWLRDARFRRPKGLLSAASLGTCAHHACEEYALTGERPTTGRLTEIVRQEAGPKFDGMTAEIPVLNQMLDQFDGWLQRAQPSYQAAEVTVYSPSYGYAGTSDGFLTIDGYRVIFDIKTSRKSFDAKGSPTGPYPEAALQLAAYRFAEAAAVWRPRRIEKFRRRRYLLSEAEREQAVPVPEVDGGLVIHITPEHCEAFPVRCDEAVHQSFLFLIEAFRWVDRLSKDVIGMPMVYPERGPS